MNPQQVQYRPEASSWSFDVGLVIERLSTLRNASDKPIFRQVRGAADLGAILDIKDFTAPEAFVVLMTEQGKPNSGQARQAMHSAFSVVIAARNYSYKQGMPALDSIASLKDASRGALIGWIPNRDSIASPGARGLEWKQGGVIDYSAGTLIWSDVYQAQTFIGRSRQ